MLRKLPIVTETPYVPGTPGRAEQVLCPAKAPTRSLPDRGSPQKHVQCYTPTFEHIYQTEDSKGRLVWVKTLITGPTMCITVWRSNSGQ